MIRNIIIAAVVLVVGYLAQIETFSEVRTDGCLLRPPPSYVQKILLNSTFVIDLQRRTGLDSVDALRIHSPKTSTSASQADEKSPSVLDDTGNSRTAVSDAAIDDRLDVLNFHSPRTRSTARVMHNTPGIFAYEHRSPLWLGGTTSKVLVFKPSDVSGYLTKFEGSTVWEGNLPAFLLRNWGLWPGRVGRSVMDLEKMDRGSIISEAVGDEWRKEMGLRSE